MAAGAKMIPKLRLSTSSNQRQRLTHWRLTLLIVEITNDSYSYYFGFKALVNWLLRNSTIQGINQNGIKIHRDLQRINCPI